MRYLFIILCFLSFSAVEKAAASNIGRQLTCYPGMCATNRLVLRNHYCCCKDTGAICPTADSGMYKVINDKTVEYVKGLSGWKAVTDATALNALTLALAVGPAEPFEDVLPVLPSPILDLDPMQIRFPSRCAPSIAQMVRDKQIPPPPEPYIEGASGPISNPAYSDYFHRVFALQTSYMVSKPSTQYRQTQQQSLNKQRCRKRYLSDTALYQSSMAHSTLAMIDAYRKRMQEYVLAFLSADQPCTVADLSDMDIGQNVGPFNVTKALGIAVPKEAGVTGCLRLNKNILTALARDRMIIAEHLKILEMSTTWKRNAETIEAYGTPIFDF